MRKLTSIILAITLILSLTITAFAADTAAIDTAIERTAAYVYNTVKSPQVDSIGGEWAVLGVARSGYTAPDAWYEEYYKTVEAYVAENGGVLHDKKYTEYSRVILGLTAAGYDPRDVAGYDLTAPLADFDKTIWQGINGPVFALIALDSRSYQVDSGGYPSDLRDAYVNEILRRQLSDGGWSLTADGTEPDAKADPDITGMVLQALAKYQDTPEVKAATDKALDCLSAMQDDKGGFNSWGSVNSESVVQVLVALCELGISIDDARFVKNGNTLADNILSFQNSDGSFNHMSDGTGNSQMSTEQALYALAALKRAQNGANSLYRMDDTATRGGVAAPMPQFLQGKHADVAPMPITAQGKSFADTAGHANQAAIEALAARGIINGQGEDAFAPNATMTRAEYAAIITRGLGLKENAVSVFEDVDSGAWYAGYVGAAYSYGIVTGTSETTFDPSGTITRQEAAVMTARAAKLCGMNTDLDAQSIRDTLAQFGDYITVAEWARPSLAFCYSAGILSNEEFDIQPTAAVVRCEIAQMLYNMLKKAKLM